jgi:hypothetical protein
MIQSYGLAIPLILLLAVTPIWSEPSFVAPGLFDGGFVQSRARRQDLRGRVKTCNIIRYLRETAPLLRGSHLRCARRDPGP